MIGLTDYQNPAGGSLRMNLHELRVSRAHLLFHLQHSVQQITVRYLPAEIEDATVGSLASSTSKDSSLNGPGYFGALIATVTYVDHNGKVCLAVGTL